MSPRIVQLVTATRIVFPFRLQAGALLVSVGLGCASPFWDPAPETRASSTISSNPSDGDAPRSSAPRQRDIPDWALTAATRDHGFEVGVGSGETLERATRIALEDVAARLSVSVEARLRETYREQAGLSTGSLEHVIETRVMGTRFKGWERTRTARVAGLYWVEVRIDRDRLERDAVTELAEISAKVDLQLESAGGSSLRRLAALRTTAPDRKRAAALTDLLDSLQTAFEREAWDARRASWRASDEAARRALIFEVRSDAASQEIARWLESALSHRRLSVGSGDCAYPFPSRHGTGSARSQPGSTEPASDRDRRPPDSTDASRRELEPVCIEVRSEIVEANVASRHVARIHSFFAVREPGRGVFSESDLVGRGDSPSDRQRARRQALDDLRRRLRASELFDGLLMP